LRYPFAGLKDLTAETTRMANLFKAANDQLEARLAVDPQLDEAVDRENSHPKRLSKARV
jgi:hypothetical protein